MKKRCKRRKIVPNNLATMLVMSKCAKDPMTQEERTQFIDPILFAAESLRVGKLSVEGLRVLIEHAYILFLLVDRIGQHGTLDAISGVIPARNRVIYIADAIDGIATRFRKSDYATATATELDAVRELMHWLDALATVVPAGHIMRAMLDAADAVQARIDCINRRRELERLSALSN